MNVVADAVIATVDWSRYQVLGGDAKDIGFALRQLLSSADVFEATVAWEKIEESVFSQGTIYSAAEPTIAVMLAALTTDQPPWRSGRIIDALFFILDGASSTDALLHDRCAARAREGLWLLTSLALARKGWAQRSVLEVIEIIAPDRFDSIQKAVVNSPD